jgi:hypothetical protein
VITAGALQDPALARRIRELGLEGHVAGTDHLEDEDVVLATCAAELLVYPSLYEGFGLPPLEAMSCGIPVVASKRASIPEVVGDAAVLVDPADPLETAEAIDRVVRDLELRRRLVEAGLRAASETLSAYQSLADPGRARPAGGLEPLRAALEERFGPHAPEPSESPLRSRLEALLELLDRDGIGRFALFCAGKHTRAVAALLEAGARSRIAGAADDRKELWGSEVEGLPVFAPAEAAGRGAEALVVSTDTFEEQALERLRREPPGLPVYRLYPEPHLEMPRTHSMRAVDEKAGSSV